MTTSAFSIIIDHQPLLKRWLIFRLTGRELYVRWRFPWEGRDG